MSQVGPEPDIAARSSNVCSTPQSEHSGVRLARPLLLPPALPVAEFLNDFLPGHRVKRPGIHVMIGKNKAAKSRIIMAGHPFVFRRIDRLSRRSNRGVEFKRGIGVNADVLDCQKLSARRSAFTFNAE
jgi:hypothetical protein